MSDDRSLWDRLTGDRTPTTPPVPATAVPEQVPVPPGGYPNVDTRPDTGRRPYGILVLVALAIAVWAVLSVSPRTAPLQGDPGALALPVIAAVGGFGAWVFFDGRARRISDTPTTRIRALVEADHVETVGLIPDGPLVHSPYGRPCVWWSWRYQRYEGGKNKSWRTKKTVAMGGFPIVDGDEIAIVARPDVDTGTTTTHKIDGNERVLENVLVPGELVWMEASVSWDGPTGGPVVHPRHVATDGEGAVVGRARAYAAVGLAVSLVGAAFIGTVGFADDGRLVATGGGVVALQVAAVVLGALGVASWRVYNGLVGLVEQYGRARSDIRVLLNRRATVIPALADTAKAAAAHERELVERVTAARTADNALERFRLVAEDYPQLRAVEAFDRLFDELVDVERHLAHERRWGNDAVALLKERSSQIPGRFVVGFVPSATAVLKLANYGADDLV